MLNYNKFIILSFCWLLLISCSSKNEQHTSTANKIIISPDDSLKSAYLKIVKEYAGFMIEKGRDRYGKIHSPLFATTLNRQTGDIYKKNPPKAPKGIRERDRTWRGANPSNYNGLYNILYKLTDITGDPKYKEEANKAIVWFFKNCQLEKTGLMPWGEHMGWDFYRENYILWKFQFWLHEMKGFGYWDLVWDKAPEAAEKFALGLWNHQIYAHDGPKAGEYSRHANALTHWPFWGKGFPSHGGKYIEVWVKAWEKTENPVFLTAIKTLLDYYERNISPVSGALRYATKFPDHYSLGHNMGLASSFYKVMDRLPDSLSVRMKKISESTDSLYLSFPHDPTPDGIGFIKSAHVHTLVPGEYRSEHLGGRFTTSMWSSGYGAGNTIGSANSCLGRHRQTGIEKYKELFMITAEAYYAAELPKAKILYPGNYSGMMGMMMNAYKLTGEKRFLDKAIIYADLSIEAIMDDSSPLPKASNKSHHYEAITGATGFMNSLLGIWSLLNE
jgi:hypothetical protein